MEVLHFKGFQEGDQTTTVYTVPEGKMVKLMFPLENGINSGDTERVGGRYSNFVQLKTGVAVALFRDELNKKVFYNNDVITITSQGSNTPLGSVEIKVRDTVLFNITGTSSDIFVSWDFTILVDKQ